MRGFLGGRNSNTTSTTGGTGRGKGKPKMSASEMGIMERGGKPAQELKIKKMLEETIAHYTGAYTKSKIRQQGGIHGENSNSGPPPELSKRTQDMIKILAHQKVQKDVKAQRKKELAIQLEEKRKIKAEQWVKTQQKVQLEQKKKAEEVAATSAKSYFFGYSDDQQ